jgi:60S ribosome subunit biogenesis protein NIP7
LIDRDEDDAYCFRLHKDRYVINSLVQASARIYKDESWSEEAEWRRSWTRKQEGSLIYRVYYLPVAMLHLATSVARSNLISLGTCFGKFSKTGKFKLGITSLDWLAKYAKYKVCQAGRPSGRRIADEEVD